MKILLALNLFFTLSPFMPLNEVFHGSFNKISICYYWELFSRSGVGNNVSSKVKADVLITLESGKNKIDLLNLTNNNFGTVKINVNFIISINQNEILTYQRSIFKESWYKYFQECDVFLCIIVRNEWIMFCWRIYILMIYRI